MSEPDSRVTYTVKDLLASVDRRLETILDKLDAKADLATVVDLKERVNNLERYKDAQEAINRERGATFSRREKIIGTLLASAAIALQFVGHIGGGHP